MSPVLLDISMSLDGFVAAADDRPGQGLHVAPVILGAGRTLFGALGGRLDLERTRVLDSPYATHIKYRVLR